MADPQVLAARLEELRRCWVPLTLDELPDPTAAPRSDDLSAEALAGRLEELRQLLRLSVWAQEAKTSRRG
jgi:hypothetical protein